jgi:hypothetical protein
MVGSVLLSTSVRLSGVAAGPKAVAAPRPD